MTALFAGSFDPPSLGHLDIIERASKLVSKLLVGIAERLEKKGKGLLTTDEKIELLKQMTKHLKNVEIVSYSGLTTDFAIKRDVTHLIRGLRLTNPIHDEFQMALANRALSNLETVFILGDERYSHISSTIIRELIFSDADLTQFIPKQAKDLLMKKR